MGKIVEVINFLHPIPSVSEACPFISHFLYGKDQYTKDYRLQKAQLYAEDGDPLQSAFWLRRAGTKRFTSRKVMEKAYVRMEENARRDFQVGFTNGDIKTCVRSSLHMDEAVKGKLRTQATFIDRVLLDKIF